VTRNRKIVLSVAAAVVLAAAAAAGVQVRANARAARQIDGEIAKLSAFARVTYEDVWVSLFSRSVQISGLSVQPAGFTSPVSIKVARFGQSGQTKSVELEDVSVDFNQPLLQQARPVLDKLGYRAVNADARLVWRMDEAAGVLEVKTLLVDAEDVAEAELSLALENAHFLAGGMNLGNLLFLKQLVNNMELAGLALSYTDKGLLRRLERWEAERLGVSVQKLREDRARQVLLHGAPVMDGEAEGALAALADFAREPDFIRIEFSPPRPVTLGRLDAITDFAQWVDALGVEVHT